MKKQTISIGLWAVVQFLLCFHRVSADEFFRLNESVHSFDSTQISVYTSPFRAESKKGLFVYSHGMTSRAIHHTALLKAAYQAGYDIVAYDLPGHGHSERYKNVKGGIKGLDQMINVLHEVIQEGVKVFGPKKVVLSGWSLGGLLTTLYLERNPHAADATVLYAPGVSLALIQGDFSIIKGVNPENLVHDPNLAKQLKQDDTFFRFAPICLVTAIFYGQYEVLANKNKYDAKTLLFTAGLDHFASTPKAIQFFDEARIQNGFELEVVHYPKSMHDLENDVDSESVIQKTVQFLDSIK